jgi:hypothetical protein
MPSPPFFIASFAGVSGMLAIVEVLIGLCVVFLIFSTVASVAIELIEAAVRRRARLLARGLAEIFRMAPADGVPADAGATRRLLIAFYRCALIAPLYLGEVRPRGRIWLGHRGRADKIRVANGRLPSYIPANRFAGAVLEAAAKAPDAPPPAVAGQPARPKGLRERLAAWFDAVKVAWHSRMTTPSIEVLKSEQADAAEFAAYCRRLRDLALRLHAGDATDEEKKLPQFQQQALEKLFAENAERMTGWFRSYTQVLLMLLGVVLAVALNVNTLRIVNVLSQDETVRTRVVNAAIDEANASRLNPSPVCNTPPSTPGDAANATPAPTGGTSAADTAADEACERELREAIDVRLDFAATLGLPLGWNDDAWPDRIRDGDRYWSEWLNKVLGWLMTALAISFGAPFWFDMLNRLTNLRTTLKPDDIRKS